MGRVVYKGDNYNIFQDSNKRIINAVLPNDMKGRVVSGIYKLSFNDYFYIGRSCNIKDRVRNHIQSLDKILSKERLDKPYQRNMFNFLMENPDFNMIIVKVLEECSEGDLNYKEQYWIDKFKFHKKIMNGTMVAAKTIRDKIWEEFTPSNLYPLYLKIDRFEDYLKYKKMIEGGYIDIKSIIKE